MNLDDLLDTLRRDILRDTSHRVSGDNDQLWSDTTLVRYINQAQRRFARRSLCIRDGTSPVTRFITQPYVQDYVLDPSVISIYSARSLGNGRWYNGVFTPGAYDTSVPPVYVPSGLPSIFPDSVDLARSSHAVRRSYPSNSDYAPFDVNDIQSLRPGKPLTWATDETMAESDGSAGVVTIRLYPIPDADYAGCTIQLRVTRLPLVQLTVDNLQAVPEIPEDYHLDMLDWAAYLALRIEDHEAGDPGRAQEFRAAFEAHVVEAREEIKRKAFVPMVWGFGGNGFGYTGN